MGLISKWTLRATAVVLGIVGATALIGAAASPKEPGIGPAVMTALIFGAGAYLLWRRSGRSDRQDQTVADEVARLAAEAIAFFESVNAARAFPVAKTDRIIDTPGRPVLASCNARLFELKTTTSRGLAGTRVKVGGMPIYLGGSVPISSTQLRESCAGELAITPDTLIFSGDLKSVDLALAKITSIDAMKDGVTISAMGRQKPITFRVPNGLLWSQLIKNLMHGKAEGRALVSGAQLEVL